MSGMSTPVGTGYYLSSTFAAAKTVASLSNDNPAEAGITSHGYSEDDELLLENGWDLSKNSVYRAGVVSDANSVLLTGLDTSNTNNFSAGGGTGTTKKISGWLELPNVLTINPTGGTPRYVDVRLIKALQGIKLPDGFEAMAINFELGFDPEETNWASLLSISRNQTLVAYKSVKGSGAATYGYGYFQMMEAPLQASGQVDRVQATFAALGRTISYAP